MVLKTGNGVVAAAAVVLRVWRVFGLAAQCSAHLPLRQICVPREATKLKVFGEILLLHDLLHLYLQQLLLLLKLVLARVRELWLLLKVNFLPLPGKLAGVERVRRGTRLELLVAAVRLFVRGGGVLGLVWLELCVGEFVGRVLLAEVCALCRHAGALQSIVVLVKVQVAVDAPLLILLCFVHDRGR